MTLLPTPKASDGPNGGPGMRNGRGQVDALPGVVALLPTPDAALALGGHESRGGARSGERLLPGIVKDLALLPTPTAVQGRNETSGRQPGAQYNTGTTLPDVAYANRFGNYAPAIARWERVLGRPAPNPTEPGRKGPRLAADFVEWLMGLPAGWVTDPAIGLTRSQQLKALGNGVVPQQVALALQMLQVAL